MKKLPDLPKSSMTESDKIAVRLSRHWQNLCEKYLPLGYDKAFWRFSRKIKPQEPLQGWKLHVSATILEACDLFEKVAPFLTAQDVLFKAPDSLKELIKINCGLQYGYHQVGKFITIYPSNEKKAVEIARGLHQLTKEFIAVPVPFDERYLPGSSVFYRYGAFADFADKSGKKLAVIKNSVGEWVEDNRFQAVPEWISNPFSDDFKGFEETAPQKENPLATTYKVFRAITQRGKGGTYQALDFSTNPPRFCIIKEGRRHGEVFWNGQDGYCLVENEFKVLSELNKTCGSVPQVFSSFEADGNFYLAMEFVEGQSLQALMKTRRRRFSIKQIFKWALEIVEILAEIHQNGWVWNDCKPANLIVTPEKTLRPIDFENSYPIDSSARFYWKTDVYSNSASKIRSARADDFYAFAVVIYYLLTGRLYEKSNPQTIKKLRPKTPKHLQILIENILQNPDNTESYLAEFKKLC